MNLKEQLDAAIWAFIQDRDNYRHENPKIIICHPATRLYLLPELARLLGAVTQEKDSLIIRYMGIKIYGSEDVKVGQFEMY